MDYVGKFKGIERVRIIYFRFIDINVLLVVSIYIKKQNDIWSEHTRL